MKALEGSRANGKLPAIVFVRHISHGVRLLKAAEKAGFNAKMVHGDTSLPARQGICDQLASGRLDVAIATKVFVEGVNIPALASVVCAQGGKSIIDTLQQIGRGMRVTSTKNTLDVWEIGDKGDPRLHAHAKARIAACQREGYRCVVEEEVK